MKEELAAVVVEPGYWWHEASYTSHRVWGMATPIGDPNIAWIVNGQLVHTEEP